MVFWDTTKLFMMNKGTKSNKLTTVKTRKEEYVASQPKTFLRRCLNKWWKYSDSTL